MNKDEIQHKIAQVLNQQPNDMEWLLIKIEKLCTGDKGRRVENWLTFIGGFGLINFYIYSLTNALNHWYFTVFLIAFIVIIIERNLQRRNVMDEQIMLLTKALRKLQSDQSKLRK